MTTEALTHRFNLMISPRQMAALKTASKETGAPASELVRRAIERAHPAIRESVALASAALPDGDSRTTALADLADALASCLPPADPSPSTD